MKAIEELEIEVENARQKWRNVQHELGSAVERNSPEELEVVDVAFNNYNTLFNTYLDLVCQML